MKFLILNSDYPNFLNELYQQHQGLEDATYDDQMKIRNESLFGTANFYSRNLRELGHEAWDVHTNNEYLQKAWLNEFYPNKKVPAEESANPSQKTEYLKRILHRAPFKYCKRFSPYVFRYFDFKPSWFYSILQLQIQYYQPDIIWNHDFSIRDSFVKKMKTPNNFLIGQIAAPIPETVNFKWYDLMLSSLPNYIEYFRSRGVQSEFQKLSFEPEILSRIPKAAEKHIPISFVGSISKDHETRTKWLEYVCKNLDPNTIEIWGTGIESLPGNSPVRGVFHGEAWGKKMYSVIHQSKITLNHHINISGEYANNMRLYEATGMGTFLITDWKKNLSDLFEPDKELVTYKSPEECVEKVRYFLEHDKERDAIAHAGQMRTINDHTYKNRMQELVGLIQKHYRSDCKSK